MTWRCISPNGCSEIGGPCPSCVPDNQIFVFGSNLAGRHGAGAAKHALDHHNAKYGQGIGLQGKSYGIPTKDHQIRTLDLDIIEQHVKTFIEFAKTRPDLQFFVTKIGCGLAGYRDNDIAPMFVNAPDNCILDEDWKVIHAKNVSNKG